MLLRCYCNTVFVDSLLLFVNKICLFKRKKWSSNRQFSPSLPDVLRDKRIWNPAHKSDPRAVITGDIVWYDALAPPSEVLLLVFCLHMRKCKLPGTEILTICVGKISAFNTKSSNWLLIAFDRGGFWFRWWGFAWDNYFCELLLCWPLLLWVYHKRHIHSSIV